MARLKAGEDHVASLLQAAGLGEQVELVSIGLRDGVVSRVSLTKPDEEVDESKVAAALIGITIGYRAL